MFDANELSVLDPKYFSIIFTDAFDVSDTGDMYHFP